MNHINSILGTKIDQQREDYLQYCLCTKRLSQNSVSAYDIDLNQFLIFLEQEYPEITAGEQVLKPVLQDYLLDLNEKYAVSSAKKKNRLSQRLFQLDDRRGTDHRTSFHPSTDPHERAAATS
ncbi:MAG: site-specific integrase [Firmicutes bacterium]|nr:site-specific integrase [Bacillota bacterium]